MVLTEESAALRLPLLALAADLATTLPTGTLRRSGPGPRPPLLDTPQRLDPATQADLESLMLFASLELGRPAALVESQR